MNESMRQRIEDWDGLGVVVTHDAPTDTWIFIALHDDRLGAPTGGTRIKVYPEAEDGLIDALRLAEGMTHKWAAIDLPSGGGKAVLALSKPIAGDARTGLLTRYGQLIEMLNGHFSTGQDLGTSTEDIRTLAAVTGHVHGYDAERGTTLDPGPYTALGVYVGIRAALRHAGGSDDLTGVSVLIQGAGGVGAPLARQCGAAGARLMLADQDAARVELLAAELGATVVEPGEVYGTACDVYAPCAVGATLNEQTIPLLGCRIVAGSANNQLAEAADAERLLARGILYAPDYVINAGGALTFGLMAQGVTDKEEIRRRLEGLGAILTEIFVEAAEQGESPRAAAGRRVQRVLERAETASAGS